MASTMTAQPAAPPPAAPATAAASTETIKSTNAKKKKRLITHIGKSSAVPDPRMTVEKGIVDELLLVCSVIGTTSSDGDELVPVDDCLNWLQDLQRALRRDDDLYRPISLLIGKWKVVPQKLFPLIMTCRYDSQIVLTVVKILVILTKPLSENTKRAGRMIIDTSSSKNDPAIVQEQVKLRENALEQAEMLMEYKRAVAHHASHYQQKEQGTGLLSVLVSLLAEPLSKSGASRTDADHLTIELVLHLIRNLLSAEPLLNTSSETSEESAQLHQELITLFERELVLEIVLVIGQEMELRENAQYNLLMMELLHHLLRSQDPTGVARTGMSPHSSEKASASSNPSQQKARANNTSSSSLFSKLKQEKTQKLALIGARHAHFGGTWMKETLGGKRSYFGATKTSQPQSVPKRKNRKAEPFIGSGRTSLAHSKHTASDQGPVTKRAQRTLHTFCQRFVKDCYGPVMKSLKNEFRRDSVRLEEGDKVVFFRIVWFFCQWCRMTRDKNVAMGQLIFTMDVFTFNLVLNATDSFYQHKKYTRLAQTVALYSEMMHLLHDMFTSKESTENIMAMGLLDRLFYASEPLDRLPKLLSRWMPGTTTREYLCDLAEVCHVSLKLLDAYTKSCSEFKESNERATDAVSKMKLAAADFDVKSYFARKIVSNQVVFMYTHLLSQYSVNAAHVNHRIIALFLRLSRVIIASPDDRDPDVPQNLLATKKVTLEPMLYNIQLFAVMEKVLNDSNIRRDKEYASLLTFCTNVMNKFAAAAQKNPMLYVECLFRHATPHKFCDLATNRYVTEELRLIAEHELLLEDQRGRQDEMEDEPDRDDDEDDDEVEFTGDTIGTGESTAKSKPSRSKRSRMIDSDEDEVEFENKQEAAKDDAEGGADEAGESTGAKQSRIVDSEDEDEEMQSESKEKADDDTVGNAKSGKPARSKQSRIVDSDDNEEEVEFGSKEETNNPTAGGVKAGEPARSKKSRAVDSDDDEEEMEFKSKEETDENDVSGDGNASESAKPKQSRIVDSDDEDGEAEFESNDEMVELDAASNKASKDGENDASPANTIEDTPADVTKRKADDLTDEAPSAIAADKRQRLDKSPADDSDSDEEVEFK